jgi:ribose/xylose/arabinose/galactoside ABC-type transport system permease subunit
VDPRVRAAVSWTQRNGVFLALILLIVFFTFANARFLTPSNLSVILLQVAILGIVAVPGAMLVLCGYVDLAVGSLAVLAAVVFGELVSAGTAMPIAFAVALGTGAVWNLIAGGAVAYLGFSPIVVSLAGLAGARGVAEFISAGTTTYGFGRDFYQLGNGQIAGLWMPVWIFAVVFVLGFVAWYRMVYGRHMTAIGADRAAARSLGVSVQRIPLVLFVLSGLAAALGGLILTSQLDGASLAIGTGLELEVLTAILLGGVSFLGGRGSLTGVFFGVLFIGVLENGLVLINISPFLKDISVGVALATAAALDVAQRRLERIPLHDDGDETAGAVPVGAA